MSRAWTALIALGLIVDALATSRGMGQPAGERYALLVGVRQYDPNELRPLPFSEPDVVELAAVLKAAGYRRVVLMTQTEGAKNFRRLPAAANVRRELKGLLEDCEPADTVVVVFAGHGVQFRGEDASYFCPMDAKLSDRSTLLSLGEVYHDLEGCGAGTKLLLVDACRNDPQSDNSRARAQVVLESVTRPQAGRPPGGIAALFSCSEGQKAYEHDALKHGVFFHFVIQGLKGEADLDKDGVIDPVELALFARKRVPAFVKDEYGPEVRQVPILKGEFAGLSPLVRLARPQVAAPAPTRPPALPLIRANAFLPGWLKVEAAGHAQGGSGTFEFSLTFETVRGQDVGGIVRFTFPDNDCAIRFKGKVVGQTLSFETYGPALKGRPSFPAYYRGEIRGYRIPGQWTVPSLSHSGRFEVRRD